MSNNWDELMKNKNYRINNDLWYSEEEGSTDTQKRLGEPITPNTEAITNILHDIMCDIASLREGLLSFDNRLSNIEKHIKNLEGDYEGNK